LKTVHRMHHPRGKKREGAGVRVEDLEGAEVVA